MKLRLGGFFTSAGLSTSFNLNPDFALGTA
jgi:hypothetical protein